MILLTVLLSMLIALTVILLIAGASTIFVFGDLLVCLLVIGLVVKLIIGKKGA